MYYDATNWERRWGGGECLLSATASLSCDSSGKSGKDGIWFMLFHYSSLIHARENLFKLNGIIVPESADGEPLIENDHPRKSDTFGLSFFLLFPPSSPSSFPTTQFFFSPLSFVFLFMFFYRNPSRVFFINLYASG
jgi:hypothetical protein